MNETKDFWDKLYKENAPKILGVCRRYVLNKEVAEDLMHDAFLTAINKHDSYAGKGCIEAWLRKIAVNTALMYLRGNNSKKIQNDWLQNENDYQTMDVTNTNDIRSVIEQSDFSDNELLEIIDKLPEHHRQVFNLYVIDNYTHAQISKELTISEGTSKSHLARARKKIQQLLYQKACEKPREKKKKVRAAILLFITPFHLRAIDKLFKSRFINFSLEPTAGPATIFNSVNWQNVQLPVIKSAFYISNLRYWFIGVTGGITTVFFVATGIRNNLKIQAAPELDSVDTIKTIMEPNNSPDTAITVVFPVSKNSSHTSAQKKQPVVIKRTLIQRKTIIVRDTIKLTDSTNAL